MQVDTMIPPASEIIDHSNTTINWMMNGFKRYLDIVNSYSFKTNQRFTDSDIHDIRECLKNMRDALHTIEYHQRKISELYNRQEGQE